MNSDQGRIEYLVELFGQSEPALVLPGLTPAELVQAILQEFTDVEYLAADPVGYQLVRAADATPLDPGQPLRTQAPEGTQLRLAEIVPPLPAGAGPLPAGIYLRELGHGQVFRLHWQPAIIGRFDDKFSQNELLAVDLAGHDAALRVSRRHAQVGFDGKRLYLEPLSQNPTRILPQQGLPVTVASRHEIADGDLIELVRGQIRLRVIVLPDPAVVNAIPVSQP